MLIESVITLNHVDCLICLGYSMNSAMQMTYQMPQLNDRTDVDENKHCTRDRIINFSVSTCLLWSKQLQYSMFPLPQDFQIYSNENIFFKIYGTLFCILQDHFSLSYFCSERNIAGSLVQNAVKLFMSCTQQLVYPGWCFDPYNLAG